MKVGFISLGCSKNLVDTEHMMGALKAAGHEIVNNPELADAVVVNTCGFIDEAKKEAIDTIVEMGLLKELGKFRILLATGCLAQRYPDELLRELPELDAVVGVKDYLRLPEILDACMAGERQKAVSGWPENYTLQTGRVISTPPGWAYLKIAEGCNNRCSYCAIPGIRGPLRSRPRAELIKEARDLAEAGVKELVLVAQDTTAYGRDLVPGESLRGLVEKLGEIEGIEWIRVMYLYPSGNAEEILSVLKLKKVVPYLDIPLQHGSDRILKLMGRRYNRRVVFDLIEKLRAEITGLALRTTLMTGFPGESEDDHRENMELLEQLQFDWAGVFAYSKEDGTVAGRMEPEVLPEVAHERRRQLLELQQRISQKKNRQRVGQQASVLVESRISPDSYRGRAYFQAPEVDGAVLIKANRSLQTGSFVTVSFYRAYGYDLIGEEKIGPT
ncbi:MAG: 30S ribosomal protein S12 methylthiotransferase RimO [Syntrophomonadaceae bacterium]|nr:30S ribosomal protein S12 methylthiotransferase RimO [Syntrophomonadaceae bacterium]